jgi:hypothetical protein
LTTVVILSEAKNLTFAGIYEILRSLHSLRMTRGESFARGPLGNNYNFAGAPGSRYLAIYLNDFHLFVDVFVMIRSLRQGPISAKIRHHSGFVPGLKVKYAA